MYICHRRNLGELSVHYGEEELDEYVWLFSFFFLACVVKDCIETTNTTTKGLLCLFLLTRFYFLIIYVFTEEL